MKSSGLLIGFLALLGIAASKPDAATYAHASWYECCNRHTASGVIFDPDFPAVAHKTLPFFTKVELEYEGRKIVVPVLDRGPFIKGRTFDLTRGAAKKLGIIEKGVARVKYRILG